MTKTTDAPLINWTPEREERGKTPDRDKLRCPVRDCLFVSYSLRVMVAHARTCRDE